MCFFHYRFTSQVNGVDLDYPGPSTVTIRSGGELQETGHRDHFPAKKSTYRESDMGLPSHGESLASYWIPFLPMSTMRILEPVCLLTRVTLDQPALDTIYQNAAKLMEPSRMSISMFPLLGFDLSIMASKCKEHFN